MIFLQPWGLLLGLLLPVIVIFYLKKKQIIEYRVPSIKLWDEVIKEIEGVKKKKINKHILLIIQLIIGSLIVLSLANPVLIDSLKGKQITVALDCSISMKALENGKTHFQKAKEEIKEYLDKLPDNTRINIILLKNKGKVYLQEAKKEQAKNALKKINCSNEGLDIENAQQLINRFSGEKVFVSNKDLSLGNKIIKIGKDFDNIGIIDAKFDWYANTVLCSIKNYSKKSNDVVITVTDEAGKKDMQSIKLFAEQEADVSFEISGSQDIITIELENKDMLDEDNKYILPLGEDFKKRVLLIGENYFLQKALASIPDITFDYTEDWQENYYNYDAYITAKDINIDKFPDNSAIWDLQSLNMVEGKLEKTCFLRVLGLPFTKNLTMQNVLVEEPVFLKEQKDCNTLLEADEKPVMLYSTVNNQRIIYSSLDLKTTNLVMLPDFPILINNILEWLLAEKKASYSPGDYIYPPNNEKVKLVLPDKSIKYLENIPYTIEELGMYFLENENQKIRCFVTNPPAKIIKGEINDTENNMTATAKPVMFCLKKLLILMVLGLLVVEWEVYKLGL